ncbi:DUF1385 domain-containing protein [Thermoactinomyces daqus]|uniref:DUF1385 domain-containing protein n=1 Tax=Thermoactinomyces daqus TaxID=1329516 RepID=A0A7W1X761_9BACL|nr:DUF1385 domain-containing protein [Thermoactinomyces daqus]MBA4541298.1 DUF1385 domain-containing protein [Thermoactinomyces daqus]
MFGGRYAQVTAVRRKTGEIEFFEVKKQGQPGLKWLSKIPLVRGIVALVLASASGAKHLQFASDMFERDHDEEAESADETVQENQSSSKWGMILGVAMVGILSLLIGKMVFTALPAFLASILFDRFVHSMFLQSLIEGAIKTILLLAYLWGISFTPLIKRVFQYHGAEHKVITAFERGEELTVTNVQKHSTLHYRCGSSFIILSIIVGVILYSFFTYHSVWDRILIRLALIPLVIGLSYELLRMTNAVKDIPILAWLGYPGLWLQKLTTKEPTDDQVEVAIAAFNRMRELDAQAEARLANGVQRTTPAFN